MSIYKFYVVSNIALSTVLAALFAVMFVKELCGSKYRVIVAITLLLLLSNLVWLVLIGIDLRVLSPIPVSGHAKSLELTWSICWTLVDLTFCVSHWLFAWYYLIVANKMPKVIERLPP